MLSSLYQLFVSDFLRIYRVLQPQLRIQTFVLFGAMFILACLEVASILSISFLALSMASPDKILDFRIVAAIFRKFHILELINNDPRMIALIASSSVVLLAALKNLMAAYTGMLSARYGEKISLYVGERIFWHYLYSPYMWHLSGDSNVVFQALAWRSYLGSLVINTMTMYTYMTVSLALFITLISATPEILLLTICIVVFISWATYASVKKRLDRASFASAEFSRAETLATHNAMNGIREVIIYRQQPVFFEKFTSACRGALPSRGFLAIASPIPPWVLEVVGFAVIPATLWIMIYYYDASMVHITAVLTMIMLASWRILPILSRALACLVTLRSARHYAFDCLSRLESTLQHPVPEPQEPDPNFALRQHVAFENVSFTYPQAAVSALQNVSFTVKRGMRLGIVGHSGAGKSTIVGILSGLMEPSSGRITVDGEPLSPSGLAAYSMGVGYVPQSPYILPGTLAQNVAFSQWGRPYDEERVRQACRMAALDIVETHPAGIEIPIGERGAGLSGGQAQRVSIARALYANPSVLIFDEATSALDHATEAAILKTIYDLPASMTTVIIAHRLTTVEQCDSILWVENGVLVAEGPPAAILPRYAAHLGVQSEEEKSA